MRRRLTLTTVAAAAIAVIVLGIPLGIAVRVLLVDLALGGLESEARVLAAALRQQPSRDAIDFTLELFAEATQSQAALVGADGAVVAASSGFSPDSVLAEPDDGVYADGRLHVAVPAVELGSGLQLHVNADAEPAQRQVRQAWLLIAVIAATALFVAAVAGSRQARDIARPLEDLAVTARRLGEGDFSARSSRSGLPEADMVADALDSTAERLGVLVERASSFSADASHQLRTPLTALRLHLETLQIATGEERTTDDALAELDRLDATITELLTLTTPGAGGTSFSPSQFVLERLDAWETLAGAEGRDVRTELAETPLVHARAAAVGQALQVLLDNALVHGEGAITVSVTAEHDGRWVRLCVADEGPGFDERRLPPPRPADRGVDAGGVRGRGLPLARSLVAAEGGSLRVERTATGARVCLLLPAAAPDRPA